MLANVSVVLSSFLANLFSRAEVSPKPLAKYSPSSRPVLSVDQQSGTQRHSRKLALGSEKQSKILHVLNLVSILGLGAMDQESGTRH